MDDKTGKDLSSTEKTDQGGYSAFSRHGESASNPSGERPADKPIPSQPRSFSGLRPQQPAAQRKNLSNPAASSPAEKSSAPSSDSATGSAEKKTQPPVASAGAPGAASKADATQSTAEAAESRGAAPAADSKLAPPEKSAATEAGAGTTKSDSTPAEASVAASSVSSNATPSTSALPTQSAASTAAAAEAAKAAFGKKGAAASAPPQSSGAGGDTIRLRVSPRPQARTLNTAPGRGVRRRLPDIRQGRSTASSGNHYGPFSLFFGFLWLIFKMVFFTALVLGLGALIGFMAMTEYIKTPEVIVPNVSGMKIDEAFDALSEKKLGVIKRGTENSGLVAPGEIISQQPPAGATAKVDTDVGVIISSGRSQYVVPNVINETKENAINKIRGARLDVGNMLTVEDNSVARGNVISQSPIGGTGTDDPVKVDLMISAGPPGKSLTMPDLTGRSVLEARAALKAVGIDDVVTEPADAPADAKVTGHDPLVGKTVFQTDRVTLLTKKK